jgi:hypothetical protein
MPLIDNHASDLNTHDSALSRIRKMSAQLLGKYYSWKIWIMLRSLLGIIFMRYQDKKIGFSWGSLSQCDLYLFTAGKWLRKIMSLIVCNLGARIGLCIIQHSKHCALDTYELTFLLFSLVCTKGIRFPTKSMECNFKIAYIFTFCEILMRNKILGIFQHFWKINDLTLRDVMIVPYLSLFLNCISVLT